MRKVFHLDAISVDCVSRQSIMGRDGMNGSGARFGRRGRKPLTSALPPPWLGPWSTASSTDPSNCSRTLLAFKCGNVRPYIATSIWKRSCWIHHETQGCGSDAPGQNPTLTQEQDCKRMMRGWLNDMAWVKPKSFGDQRLIDKNKAGTISGFNFGIPNSYRFFLNQFS